MSQHTSPAPESFFKPCALISLGGKVIACDNTSKMKQVKAKVLARLFLKTQVDGSGWVGFELRIPLGNMDFEKARESGFGVRYECE